MRIVRAAVVQDSPIFFEREATIEKVHFLVCQAARQRATLVVMPEAFVSAYSTGLDFGSRIDLRQPNLPCRNFPSTTDTILSTG